MLFQVGASKSGVQFASRHAEAMFLNPCTVKQAKKVIAEARAAAAAEGRDPQSLKFFPCIVPIIGRTEEEAWGKYEKAKSHADIIGGLAQVRDIADSRMLSLADSCSSLGTPELTWRNFLWMNLSHHLHSKEVQE